MCVCECVQDRKIRRITPLRRSRLLVPFMHELSHLWNIPDVRRQRDDVSATKASRAPRLAPLDSKLELSLSPNARGLHSSFFDTFHKTGSLNFLEGTVADERGFYNSRRPCLFFDDYTSLFLLLLFLLASAPNLTRGHSRWRHYFGYNPFDFDFTFWFMELVVGVAPLAAPFRGTHLAAFSVLPISWYL